MDKYIVTNISTLEIKHVLSAIKTMRENNAPVDYIRIGEGVEFGVGVRDYLRKQKIEVR